TTPHPDGKFLDNLALFLGHTDLDSQLSFAKHFDLPPFGNGLYGCCHPIAATITVKCPSDSRS
ncbi:MAG: hypothetical protein WBO55_05990, partial [Rhizobiaceae bacterium]